MKKQYTVFVATDELCTSSIIMWYGGRHDYIWRVNQTEEIMITLPVSIQKTDYKHIHLLYNPDLLDVLYATVTELRASVKEATRICLRVRPRELGSTTLGVTFEPPQHNNQTRRSYLREKDSVHLAPSL